MTKEAGDVPKAVGLVTMDGRVVIRERLFKAFIPDTIEFAEAFADETVERRV